MSRCLVMVQREVGERIVAGPGTKAYGAVSVKVGYYAAARMVGTVAATVFVPPPNVASALVRLARRPAPPVQGPSPRAPLARLRAGLRRPRKNPRPAPRAHTGRPPLGHHGGESGGGGLFRSLPAHSDPLFSPARSDPVLPAPEPGWQDAAGQVLPAPERCPQAAGKGAPPGSPGAGGVRRCPEPVGDALAGGPTETRPDKGEHAMRTTPAGTDRWKKLDFARPSADAEEPESSILVDYRKDDQIAVITLNRPQADNAITTEMGARLTEIVETIAVRTAA